jgi:hypothetical protein
MSKKKTQLLLLSCAKLSARACDAHAFSVQKRRSTTAFKGCISRLPPLSRSNMIYFFVHNSAFFIKLELDCVLNFVPKEHIACYNIFSELFFV